MKHHSSAEGSPESHQCKCRRGCHSKKSCLCKTKGAFCTKKCHPHHHCTNTESLKKGSTSATIDLTDEQNSLSLESSKDKPNLWRNCYGIKLNETHREMIRTGEWLCDQIIDSYQRLLKNQHLSIGGFQSTLLAKTLAMDPQ